MRETAESRGVKLTGRARQITKRDFDDFDYIICESPAGIERGAHLAMYYADEAVVVTNPEVSSVRDSDRVLGLLSSKTYRAEKGEGAVKPHLLLQYVHG